MHGLAATFSKSTMPRKRIFEPKKLKPSVEELNSSNCENPYDLHLLSPLPVSIMHERAPSAALGAWLGAYSKLNPPATFNSINFYSNVRATRVTRLLRCFRKCALQSLLSTIELAHSS